MGKLFFLGFVFFAVFSSLPTLPWAFLLQMPRISAPSCIWAHTLVVQPRLYSSHLSLHCWLPTFLDSSLGACGNSWIPPMPFLLKTCHASFPSIVTHLLEGPIGSFHNYKYKVGLRSLRLLAPISTLLTFSLLPFTQPHPSSWPWREVSTLVPDLFLASFLLPAHSPPDSLTIQIPSTSCLGSREISLCHILISRFLWLIKNVHSNLQALLLICMREIFELLSLSQLSLASKIIVSLVCHCPKEMVINRNASRWSWRM